MFTIFGSKRKSRKSYRRKTESDLEKEQVRKDKQWAKGKMLEKAKDNPELENQYIANLIGIEIKPPDPTLKQKIEIKKLISDEALLEIKNDPELRKEFARKQVEELIGESVERSRGGDGEFGYRGSAIAEALEDIESIEELKNKLGGNKGSSWADVFKDPLVANTLLSLVKSAMVGSQQGTQSSRVYVVEVNGVLTELTEGEYGKFLQEKEHPVLEKSVLEKEPTQTGELGEKVGEPVAGLPFFDIDEMIPFADEIVAAMDKDPDEVAINLIENASGDDSNSKALLNFLSKATYDQIYELITPYKDNPKLSSYVQKIIENRKWIEDVIEQLKTLGMQYQEA